VSFNGCNLKFRIVGVIEEVEREIELYFIHTQSLLQTCTFIMFLCTVTNQLQLCL
jgi:hypothetical protein